MIGEREIIHEHMREYGSDNVYYTGPFWIIADTIEDIKKGKYKIKCVLFETGYDGKSTKRVPKEEWTHKGIWNSKFKEDYKVDYDYYPRGRVSIKDGIVWINIPPEMNQEDIIEDVIGEYGLRGLIKSGDPKISLKGDSKTDHYHYFLGQNQGLTQD